MLAPALDIGPQLGRAERMAPFDDSANRELGAACNRLATWVESLPAGVVVDSASDLTEQDLAMILRHLHQTRRDVLDAEREPSATSRSYGRTSVPITARD